MRKILLIACVLFQSIAFAQDVPSKVQSTFKKKFPNAEEASWSTISTGHEVEFEENEDYKSAKFDKAGAWTETRYSISDDDLPEVVAKAVSNKYPNSYTEEVVKIEAPKATSYELRVVTNDESTYLVHVSKNGKILKNTSISHSNDRYKENDW